MPIALQPPFVTMLIVVLAFLLHFLLAPWQIVLRVPIFGALLFMLGFSLIMWARIHFTSRNTTLFVGRISAHLVCNGPFRFSRNPMYVGVVALLSGIALWFGTLPMLLVVPVALFFLHFFHIPREEEMLRATFGDEYAAYSQEVRRWL